MSGLARVILRNDSSDEERPDDDNTIQRASSRPTREDHLSSSKRKDRNVAYQEPAGFDNLDEEAVPPPIDNREDQPTYRHQPRLDEPSQASRAPPQVSDTAQIHESVPRKDDGEQQGLSEVAAPAPVQEPSDDDSVGDIYRRRYLEDGEEEPQNNTVQSRASNQQRQPTNYQSSGETVPKLLTELYTISYLIFFAIIGTLARLGTQWITFYPGAPLVTPVIWANFAGSLIMGFLAEDQGLFQQATGAQSFNQPNGEKQQDGFHHQEDKAAHSKRKKTVPLYIGLATGFCGSYTSFSAFARDFFLALSNNLPTPVDHPYPAGAAPSPVSTVDRHDGYSFEAFLHVVISTIALSLGGLIAGAQIAIFMSPVTPRIHGTFVRKYLDRMMVLLAFGCWLGAIFLAIWPPDRTGGPASLESDETWRGQAIFACVFAPVGCLLRFYASMKLNGLVPAFPLGTFAVNMFGAAVEGLCFDIQQVGVGTMGRIGGGIIGCQVLQGILDGFCGCLTTVSTWVAEINGLKRKHGWLYAFSTVLGGLCLTVVIMGSVRWSIGYSIPACNVGYPNKVHG